MNSSVLIPAQRKSSELMGSPDVATPEVVTGFSHTEWQQKYKPQGPCCEWPRWQGGDPAERWPQTV